MWAIFKVFIEFVMLFLPFFTFWVLARDIWDLTSMMEPAAPVWEDGPPGKSPETSFSKAGRESGGGGAERVSMNHSPFYTGMPWGTCHLQQCPTYSASLLPKGGLQEGCGGQNTALSPKETGRQKPQRQLLAPSTCPELSRGPGAHSSSGLGGYHPAVPEEPRNLHPAPPQPLPHKTLLTDFSLHCHDLAKSNQGELSYPLASWSF